VIEPESVTDSRLPLGPHIDLASRQKENQMIVVTGAAGRLGRAVVRRLLETGHEVRGTDRVPFDESPTPFVQADLCDPDVVADIMDGAEALIHMGAIPGPNSAGPYEMFRNNGLSSFNIMMAAADQQVRRIVFSSSAFGMGWADDPEAFVPAYLPLDEEHEMTPFESYGLSKQVGEYIARMIARSTLTTAVSLRFTNVARAEMLAKLPLPPPTPQDPVTLVMWAYAHIDDVAEAHRLSLDADIDGHESFLIAQPPTRFREPTIDLVRENFGDRVEIRGDLSGNASVISTAKAQRMLGLVPSHDWTTEIAG
jgi:UDP-glucose 4-epimerase